MKKPARNPRPARPAFARSGPFSRGLSLLATAALCWHTSAFAITDDFSDGDDTANPPWTHSNIGLSTAGYDASGLNYHLTSPVGGFGISYAGSFLADTMSDFTISMDLVDWQSSSQQKIGIYARASDINVALGLDGYHFSYDPIPGQFLIRRMVNANQGGSNRASTNGIFLDVAKDYQFIFIGAGTNLNARVYEIGGPATPVVELNAIDTTFTSGLSGVIGFGGGATDFTIDNFSAEPVPEPAAFALLLLGGLALGRSLLRRRSRMA